MVKGPATDGADLTGRRAQQEGKWQGRGTQGDEPQTPVSERLSALLSTNGTVDNEIRTGTEVSSRS